MKYRILFHYTDGEDFQIDIHPDDIEPFMKSLGKSEVYFNKERGVGVWIPIDKIRYFSVEMIDQNGRRIQEEKQKEEAEKNDEH